MVKKVPFKRICNSRGQRQYFSYMGELYRIVTQYSDRGLLAFPEHVASGKIDMIADDSRVTILNYSKVVSEFRKIARIIV